MKGLNEVKNFLVDILFPKTCIGCGREGEYICQNCRVFFGEAPLICPVCQKPSFGGQKHEHCSSKHNLDGLVSVWEYEGAIKRMIHQIKYAWVTDVIPELLRISAEAMARDPSRFSSFFAFIAGKNPTVTFVPMHIRKEKKRGFNQAKLIAEEFGKITNLKVAPLLKKDRKTEPQEKLDREKRLENVKGVFSPLRNQRFLTGFTFGSQEGIPENLILIDDVWTTGATMKECSRVLKKAGAKKVWGFTLARTV